MNTKLITCEKKISDPAFKFKLWLLKFAKKQNIHLPQ